MSTIYVARGALRSPTYAHMYARTEIYETLFLPLLNGMHSDILYFNLILKSPTICTVIDYIGLETIFHLRPAVVVLLFFKYTTFRISLP